MGGRQFPKAHKPKQATRPEAVGQFISEAKPTDKALNKSDSIAVTGILLGVLFVILVPPPLSKNSGIRRSLCWVLLVGAAVSLDRSLGYAE
jgi:hypothetical protein